MKKSKVEIYEIYYCFYCPYCNHLHHTMFPSDKDKIIECDICNKSFELKQDVTKK